MTIPDPRDYMGPPLVEIVAYARPAGQGSKRHVGNGRMIEQSEYVKPFRDAITAAAKQAVGPDWVPLDGPLSAAYIFTIEKPKRPKFDAPATPPDSDKLERAANDALSPIKDRKTKRVIWQGVWVDDSRVTTTVYKDKTFPSFTRPGALLKPGITLWIWKGN